MKLTLLFPVSIMALGFSLSANAAQLIDLKDQSSPLLQSMVGTNKLRAAQPSSTSMKEVSRYTDFNHVTHTRMQEYFQQYPIWNAYAVTHTSQSKLRAAAPSSANGQVYQKLEEDLSKAPSVVFNKQQAARAVQYAMDQYQSKQSDSKYRQIKNAKSTLMVYVDDKQEAHWAFKVEFSVPPHITSEVPSHPIYILDAVNFKIYLNWDNVKTASADDTNPYVSGGGFGGNPQTGKLNYDDLDVHLAAFKVKRDGNTCYLQNSDSVITHAETKKVMQYPCEKQDPTHNNLFWSADFDQTNGSYSPANDAFFAAQVLKQFYKKMYNVPVLINKEDGSEMVLHMNVHVEKMQNAYWDNNEMTFGDGGMSMYPLTSLGIAAHEVSHGFTEQHSGLMYTGQSGGMNEAFSDMAAQAAEFYAQHGKNSWLIGGEIFKLSGETLRYMDQPSKDCYGKEPGTFCSIDKASQYYPGLNVHHSSGVYNRAFYLLSITPGWDPIKAFGVMVHANASYWLPQTQYADGAACAAKAAADLQQDKQTADKDKQAVENAFKAVGIRVPERCTNSEPK